MDQLKQCANRCGRRLASVDKFAAPCDRDRRAGSVYSSRLGKFGCEVILFCSQLRLTRLLDSRPTVAATYSNRALISFGVGSLAGRPIALASFIGAGTAEARGGGGFTTVCGTIYLLITIEVLRDRPAVLNAAAPIHGPRLPGPTLRSDGRPRFMPRCSCRLRAWGLEYPIIASNGTPALMPPG